MTNPSPKDRVLAFVRSKNPQTMELREGSRFRIIDQQVADEAPEWAENEVFVALRVRTADKFGDGYCTAYRENGREFVYHPDQPSDAYLFEEGKIEILGSDMGLQELLIALKTLHPKPAYFGVHTNHPFGCESFHEGKLVIHVQATFSPFSFNVPFDLTKNLHEQSDDFYASILPLLP